MPTISQLVRSSPCSSDKPERGQLLHPRRGTQPAGALNRAGSRWSCKGPSWCTLSHRSWYT